MKILHLRRLLVHIVINCFAFALVKAQTIDGIISVRSPADTDNFQEMDRKGAAMITQDNLSGEIR